MQNQWTKQNLLFLLLLIGFFQILDQKQIYSATSDVQSKQSAVVRNDTFAIEQFEGLNTTISSTTNYAEGIPFPTITFEPYFVGFVDISSITFDVSGGNCELQIDKKVFCTGSPTSLSISYTAILPPTTKLQLPNWYKLPWFSPPSIFIELGGYNFSVDYTLDVTYPSTLTYISSTIEPNTHQIDQRRLSWSQSNMTDFRPVIQFYDSRLKGIWLPLVVK